MSDSIENAAETAQGKKVKKERPGKVGFFRNLWWQSRGASLGVNTLMMGFLSIYCTDTLKISPAVVGTMLMASKIFDGFTDAVAGFIVDNTNTRLGRGRPYEFAIIGAWFCTWLMFTGSPEWAMFAKCAWVFSMYVLINSVWATLLNAAQTPYTVRAWRSEQIVTISTYGSLVSMLVAVAFNISFPMAMGALATSARGWSTLVAIFAIPLAAIGMLRFIFIKETIVIKDKGGSSANAEKLRVKDVVSTLKVNPYIFIILILSFSFNIITNMGVNIYYFTYIVHNVGSMGVLAAAQIVVLPLMFVFPAIIRKFSVIKLMSAGLLVVITGYIINFFAWDNVALLVVGNLLAGAGVVPIAMLTGLLIIDCADYNEWKKEARLEGTMSSLNGLGGKIGSAVGAGLLGVLLAVVGYSGSVETATPATITMIRMLFSAVPAVMYAALFIMLRFYKLDKLMPQVRKENEANRLAAAQAGV